MQNLTLTTRRNSLQTTARQPPQISQILLQNLQFIAPRDPDHLRHHLQWQHYLILPQHQPHGQTRRHQQTFDGHYRRQCLRQKGPTTVNALLRIQLPKNPAYNINSCLPRTARVVHKILQASEVFRCNFLHVCVFSYCL